MSKFKWVVILLLLSGCYGKDVTYPVEEQYKVEYNVGDILEYQSNTGEKFFLKVMDIYTSETAASKGGSGAPYYYYQHEFVIYDSVNRKVINKPPTNIISTEQPRGFVRWPMGLFGCITSGCSPQYHETMTINGVVYDDVFRLPATNNNKGEITSWYYSYKLGFVGFELMGNRVFNLVR